MLEEKLNIELEQSELGDGTLRSISQEWTRIGQLLLNRKRLRWEKLLLEAIRKFPQEFHELVFRLLTKRALAGESPGDVGQLLRNVGEEAHVKVVYF
jgi:DNA-binding transcriptional ArsR family regulator